MKKLLLITLFFFSIGAMAEENFRCKLFEDCSVIDSKKVCNNRDDENEYLSVRIDESWFSKKFFVNGTLLKEKDTLIPWVIEFDETKIISKQVFTNTVYRFDRVSKIFKWSVSTEKGKLSSEYLCEKTT